MRLLSACLFISVISCRLFGQTYTASPFAGSELPPHDIPAITAGFGPVGGVAVDAAGNVFMSLSLYNSVVRLDATTGILSLVAGNGTYGYSGDNGPATSAQLLAPQGLALDSTGSLYIADAGNLRVRKVSNGVISTIAGNGTPGFSGDNGPAANAQFGQALPIGDEDPDTLPGPRGVAVDSAGNLYIADAANNRIRKVSGGVITTIAGDGTSGFRGDGGQAIGARLSMPWGVAADSAGNLYIADRGNQRVRKVADGLISTLAGNGTQGFSGDNGTAVNAQLGSPYGVIVDSAGSVYIADALNNRIRKVANDVITTVAGNGTPGFGGDGGPAISARLSTSIAGVAVNAGNLYIADIFNNRIRKVVDGTITTVAGDGALHFGGDNSPAVNAQLYDPYGVAVDSAGNVYIADTLNNRVRRVSNGVITTVAGNGTAGFSGDNGPAIDASLFTPIGVALDSAGNLYIADVNNSRVRKVANGVITTVPGTAGFTPFGVAIDSTGSVYIAAAQHNRIIKVSNGVASTLAGTGTFGLSGDGGPAIAAQVGAPTSVAVDAAGNVYFADAGATGNDYLPSSGAVRKVSNGVITTITGGNAVTVDDAGSVYVGDETLNLIRKISRGVITAMPVSPALGFRSWQIAVDSAGHVYCEDALRTGILVLTATGAATLSSVSVDGVTNGASNLPIPIAPGEILTLSGSGLGPSQLTAARPRSDGFYDTQLAGTSVQFNGFPAPVLYASATQVGVVVPYAVTGASAQITVSYQGQSGPPPTVAIAKSALALFTADSTGKGQAAAVNEDGSINGPSTPAPIGSVISLYATGEGQTSPQGIDGKPAMAPFPKPNFPIVVTFGADDAQVLSGELQYVGGAPGEVAGLLQINVRIPAGLMPGKAVPVFISNGARQSQAGVTIAVSRN